MNILLVTTRNIFEQTGEYKLIYRRAEELNKKFNIKTEFIAFQRKSRIENSTIEFDDDFKKVIAIGFTKKSLIGDYLKFRKELKKYLYKKKPTRIIVSGHSIFYYEIIKKYKADNRCRIYFDNHGCDEEIIEYKDDNRKNIYKFIVKILDIFTGKLLVESDGILVVSESMKEYLEKKFILKEKKFFSIPCGNSGLISSNKERFEARNIWRKNLGISDDEMVFVYSGGVSKWQMIGETIDFLINLHENNPNSKICIFSRDLNRFSNLKYLNDKVIFKSIKNKELTLALSACDFGVMIRDDSITNEIAFPTKFGDYIEAGLTTIIAGVKSQVDIINDNNLGIGRYSIGELEYEGIETEIKECVYIRLNKLEENYDKCDLVIENFLNYSNTVTEFGEDIIN